MGKRFMCLLVSAILLSVFMCGCWDKVEIDQRAIVGVIMVDMAPPGYQEKVYEINKDVPEMQNQKEDMIKVTYGFAKPVVLAGEGSGDDKPIFVSMSSVGTTMDKVNSYVDSRISRRLFFGFTQVIIFSEDFLMHPNKVKEVIDYFRRNPEFGRSMRVLVSVGEASKVSEINPKGERLLSSYIRGILENESSNGMITDITFNELVTMISSSGMGILPYVNPREGEVKISGIGLIKDFKLSGYLSEYDSSYFNELKGTRKTGSVFVNIDGIPVSYVIQGTKRSIKLINDDPDKLEIEIKVTNEGYVPSSEADKEIFNSDFIKKAEKGLNKLEEKSCSLVIKKLQKDYNLDALMMGDYLMKYHPDIWSKVKDKWNDVYPEIKITPVVDNKIRRIGSVK